MRARRSLSFLGSLLLLSCLCFNAWGMQDTFQSVSIVLGWIPLSPDWLSDAGRADEQLTKPLCYQLGTQDDFRMMTPPAPQLNSFLTSLERLLTEALRAPELGTHRRKAVVLVISGSRWEQEDARTQAEQLALLTRVSEMFLAEGVRLYGVVTGDPPHTGFLIKLANASNLDIDGTNTYWFKAGDTRQLADAYARILVDLRQLDSGMYVRSGISTTRLLLTIGIVAGTLAGMGLLTWRLLPHEWFIKLLWWRKPQDEEFEEGDLVEELDKVILGTVPDSGEKSA